MSNINFTNPYLLFIGLGLIIVISICFFVGIKKRGFNFHTITSYVLHIVMAIVLTLALARMTLRLVITETDVYVLADVSYSSNRNLDTIDTYIEDLNKNLPKNSKVGIVCYGKNYELLVRPGEELKSVKESNVDNRETNIKPALEYTASLFDESVIKRIVIISDGGETNESSISGLISDYASKKIHIDAIFLDNNLKEGDVEFQISDVEVADTAYLNDEVSANVLIDSNTDVDSVEVILYSGDEKVASDNISLTSGINNHSFTLDTSVAGEFSYKVEVKEYKENGALSELNPYNNTFYFRQTISDKIRVLYIGDSIKINDREQYNDKTRFTELYSEDKYDVTYFTDTKDVPYTLEDFCKFDEIVLSNIDTRKINNAENFVSNLDKAVSEYGKSLVTIGNTYVQNKNESETETEKEILTDLSSMLPVRYDVADGTKRLFTIVLDVSRSMYTNGLFTVAKDAASAIIDLLTENDTLLVVGFYGDVYVVYNFNEATAEHKAEAKEVISKTEPREATSLGAALKTTYDKISEKTGYSKKEIILISDGKADTSDESNVKANTTKLINSNVHVSSFYICLRPEDVSSNGGTLMKQISSIGKGNFYQAWDKDSANVTMNTISDDVKEVYKNSNDGYNVTINKLKDDLVKDISSVEKVNDFYISNAKSTASAVLQVTDENSKKYPLYATWKYGEGKVSSIATSLRYWTSETNGYKMSGAIVNTNTPNKQIYTPFLFEVYGNGSKTNVSVAVPNYNTEAKATLTINYPNGGIISKEMSFTSTNYFTTYEADEIGEYKLTLTYELGDLVTEETIYTSVSYFPEYDSFNYFDSSKLYSMITNDGKVSEDGKLTISNDGLEMTTYKYEFAPLLMIIACVLFVADVAIRKLRWQDIKDIFKKKTIKKVND